MNPTSGSDAAVLRRWDININRSGCIIAALLLLGPATRADRSAVLIDRLAETPGDTELLLELKTLISSSTDVGKKARLGTVYCLGCFYTGNMAEANRVRAYLKRTYTSDPNLSYLEPKELTTTCHVCDARPAKAECSSCRGTGECKVCSGEGGRHWDSFSGGSYKKCKSCKGRGRCLRCNGSGSVAVKCKACNGEGREFSRAAVKRTYLTLLRPTTQEPAKKTTLASTQQDAAIPSSTSGSTLAIVRDDGISNQIETMSLARMLATNPAAIDDLFEGETLRITDTVIWITERLHRNMEEKSRRRLPEQAGE